jgi:cobalt-precorrin 5A hydrolase
MKKISIISFTGNGTRLCAKLKSQLVAMGYETSACAIERYSKEFDLPPLTVSLKEWTKEQFQHVDGIIFIGATGIAVRAIAPFITQKISDPAVIVMDEKASFVIPILSGHIGGANELARELSKCFNSIPVITTATDINDQFAVDSFAVRNKLYISNMEYAKFISAALLRLEEIGMISDLRMEGLYPKQISPIIGTEYGICISISEKKQPYPQTLKLIPKLITLGIGCKKGKSMKDIEEVVLEVLSQHDISIHAVNNVATIDLKKEEKGLLEFCRKYDLEFTTYSADSLGNVLGDFIESEYVKQVTGVGNVCERAASLGSDYGTILQKKVAKDGVTVSIARKEQVIYFE